MLMKNQNELSVIPLKPDMGDMLDLDPESQQILNEKKARTQELKYEIQDRIILGEDVTKL